MENTDASIDVDVRAGRCRVALLQLLLAHSLNILAKKSRPPKLGKGRYSACNLLTRPFSGDATGESRASLGGTR
jgi:hypothetical protein